MKDDNLDSAMLHLKAELNLRGYSEQQALRYFSHNTAFLDFISKSWRYVQKKDIENYLDYLLSDKDVSSGLFEEIIFSLNFFYNGILKKNFEIKYAPEIQDRGNKTFGKEDIRKLIESSDEIRQRILIKLMFSTGLRLSECISLKIADIDVGNKLGFAKNGKKVKQFPLAESVIPDIITYLDTRKDDNPYLFNSQKTHISPKESQEYLDIASEKAHLGKITFPVLRDSFLAQLNEAGYNKGVLNSIKRLTKKNSRYNDINDAFEFIRIYGNPIDFI